jgi:predicted phosphodiesterase
MRVAVLSDVQDNLPALETVVAHIQAWQPDLVIMNGDLISRGPSSLACLELFDDLCRREGWLPVKGNHEEYVLHCGTQAPRSALDAAMRRFADWTLAQLGERVALLRDWPDHLCLQGPGEQWLHATHGSLAGNRDGITASLTDEALAGKVPEDVAMFLVAHTHKPLLRPYKGMRILNVGSAGAPFDGDIRLSYARLEHRNGHWQVEIPRLEYDRERTARDFETSGFLDQGGPLARFIFEEWRRARLMMPLLQKRYLKPLLAAEIGLEAAVAEFLADL